MSTRPTVLFDGPFKGFYSLAIVNRRIARYLGAKTALTVRPVEPDVEADPYFTDDGLGAFLDPARDEFDIHLRNTWPPSTEGMRGKLNAYVSFAWEETRFPADYVDAFNRDLDFLVVVSNFCAEAFLRSGLRIPLYVIGNEIEAHADAPANVDAGELGGAAPHRIYDDAGGYAHRILHISSCFWRKGIDLLVEAFCREFADDATACLIIKTFDNPDNIIEAVMKGVEGSPASSRIFVIREGWGEGDLRRLIRFSTCLAQPSRGEGFLLTAAEAMALGTPVVTTSFSGQTDFCTPDTAWLVDFDYIASQSHVKSEGSLIGEPRIDSLRAGLRQTHPSLRGDDADRRVGLARALVESLYSAEAVGGRLWDALRREWQRPSRWDDRSSLDDVVIVSTWDAHCGIAEYTKALCQTLLRTYHDAPAIVAPTSALDPLEGEAGPIEVLRSGALAGPGLLELTEVLKRRDERTVWWQNHLGHTSEEELGAVAGALGAIGKRLIITAHNALDWRGVRRTLALAHLYDVHFIVHALSDLNHLHRLGYKNIHALDHPIDTRPRRAGHVVRDSVDDPVVVSFGFLLPHKGFDYLLYAMPELQQQFPGITLKLFTASQGNIKSDHTLDKLLDLATFLGIEDRVTINTDYLTQEEVSDGLAASDLIVLPYLPSREEASGALRTCLRTGAPILTSDISLFESTKTWVPSFRSGSVASLVEMTASILRRPALRRGLSALNHSFVERQSWARLVFEQVGVVRVVGEKGFDRLPVDAEPSACADETKKIGVDTEVFIDGFHDLETGGDGEPFRWMSREGTILLSAGSRPIGDVYVRVVGTLLGRTPRLRASVNGRQVDVTAIERSGRAHIYHLGRCGGDGGERAFLTLASEDWGVPAMRGPGDDTRELSIMVSGLYTRAPRDAAEHDPATSRPEADRDRLDGGATRVDVHSASFVDGFHPVEMTAGGMPFRWMSRKGTVSLPPEARAAENLYFEVAGVLRNRAPRLRALVNDSPAQIALVEKTDDVYLFHIERIDRSEKDEPTLSLISEDWGVPAEIDLGDDVRELSVMVSDLFYGC